MKKLIISLSLILASLQQYLQAMEVFKAPEIKSKISQDYVDVSRPETPSPLIQSQMTKSRAKTTDNIVKEQNNSYRPNKFNESEFYEKPTQNFLALKVQDEQNIIKNIQKNGTTRVKQVGALDFRTEDNPAELKEALKGKSLNEISTNLTNLLNTTEDINIVSEINAIARSTELALHNNKIDNKTFSNLAIMTRDKARIINTLSNKKLSLAEKQTELQDTLTKLNNSNNGGSDYYTMTDVQKNQITAWAQDALEQVNHQQNLQNLQNLPFYSEEITYKPNEQSSIRKSSIKDLADDTTRKSPSLNESIYKLEQSISRLNELAESQLNRYKESRTTSEQIEFLSEYIQTSATILWKQGAVSRMKLQQFFIDLFTKTNTNVPKDEIDNMAIAAEKNAPQPTDSIGKQASWIESISKMISDVITKFKSSKNATNNDENFSDHEFRL
ncbi:MAG: hypothetical protein ACXWL2_02050 [Candidatus Chromulinivorax sp.]